MASIWDQLFGAGQISEQTAKTLNGGKTFTESEIASQSHPIPAVTVSTTGTAVPSSMAVENKPVTPFMSELQSTNTPAVTDYVNRITGTLPPAAQETAGTLVNMQQPSAQDAAYMQAQTKRQGRLNNLEDAYNMQQEAVMKGASAGAQQAAAESAYLKGVHEEAENMRKQEATRELERQDKLNTNLTKLQTAMDEFSKMQVDPNRADPFSADKTTGSKIMSGIALFLGAAPNSSGQNRAVQVMQNAMERDIAAQKANIAAKGQALESQRGIFSQMKDMFGDDRAAAAATRAAYINNAQLKLQQIAAQYKAPQVKANAENLYGQLEAAKQKEMINFEQATVASQSMQTADELLKNIYRLPKELQKQAIEEYSIVKAYNNNTRSIDNIFKDAKNTVGGWGVDGRWPWGEDKAKVDTYEAQLFPLIKGIVGERMTDQDARKLVEPLVPRPGDTNIMVDVKHQKLKELISRQYESNTPILNGFGLKPKSVEEKAKTLKPN